MGTTQSSLRPSTSSSSSNPSLKHHSPSSHPSSLKSGSRNNSGTNLHHNTHQTNQYQYNNPMGNLGGAGGIGGGGGTSAHLVSSSPTPGSSLQKSLSRRRSSGKTAETSSSHGSTGSTGSSYSPKNLSPQQQSQKLPIHQEEETEDSDFRMYNGRRYHNTERNYMLPNDTQEIDRLHLQHYIFKMAMNDTNFHVPLPECARVIDLGCGPATWTMDMATDLALVNFVGVDVSPIFPTAIHPRNCNFYKEDFVAGVSQRNDTFDLAYQRNVCGGLTGEEWSKAMHEAYRILKPGGWYECVESDVTIQDAGPKTQLVYDHLRQSMSNRGVEPKRDVRTMDQRMLATGFVDVQVRKYTVKVADWGGKVGGLWKENMFQIFQTVRPFLARAAGISEGEVQEIVQAMEQEMVEYKATQTIWVVVGMKPWTAHHQ